MADELEAVDYIILAMGIASRGIEQISGWLAGMALIVMTALTNS